jgi:Rps23 Pro-64 3,4-dihydroxylase Tpa1-like proline 4-hydroxylase
VGAYGQEHLIEEKTHVPQVQLQHAATAPAAMFRINPELDLAAIRRDYEEQGRVRIYSLLADGAAELYEHLIARTDWFHAFTTDRGIMKLEAADKAALSAGEWAAIEAEAHERARRTFQYRYEALPVPELEQAGQQDDLLARFVEWLHGAELIRFLESVTGHRDFSFREGQVTAFGPGDFLTGHDDGVHGKDRLCALVFGLTPLWRLEYGGLLMFHGEMDRTFTGNVPRFNSLDIFKVPQQHSVSIVTPAAPHKRVSITGWLWDDTASPAGD